MEIKTVSTNNAPKPGGHYSQGIVYNGLVFVSGQLSIDPETGDKKLGSIEEQTEQALKNVAEILKAAGSGLDRDGVRAARQRRPAFTGVRRNGAVVRRDSVGRTGIVRSVRATRETVERSDGACGRKHDDRSGAETQHRSIVTDDSDDQLQCGTPDRPLLYASSCCESEIA